MSKEVLCDMEGPWIALGRPALTTARRLFPLLLAGAVGFLGAGCDGSSPTEPGSPSRTQVVIQDSGGLFTAHHATIRELLERTAATARSQLAIDPVTFFVYADPVRTIRDYGIGGFAPDGQTVEIVVDPAYPGLAQTLPLRLPPVTAHELHHVARWRGPGYGVTLLEALVSEGLADRFAIELLGTPVQPWSDAFPEDQTSHYLARARAQFDDPAFDFFGWFLGTDPSLPHWTGYTLGFRLVGDYQARTGRSAAELVHTPAEVFRPD